jgi:hypothetical protein
MAGMIMLGPKVTKRELEEIEAPKTQEIEVPKAPR